MAEFRCGTQCSSLVVRDRQAREAGRGDLCELHRVVVLLFAIGVSPAIGVDDGETVSTGGVIESSGILLKLRGALTAGQELQFDGIGVECPSVVSQWHRESGT